MKQILGFIFSVVLVVLGMYLLDVPVHADFVTWVKQTLGAVMIASVMIVYDFIKKF